MNSLSLSPGVDAGAPDTTFPPAPQTYFDLLPIPLLERIVRFTSKFPRRTAWEAHITERDVITLLRMPAPLCDVTYELCTELTVTGRIGFAERGIVAHVFDCVSADRCTQLVGIISGNLLRVNISYDSEVANGIRWVSHLLANCPRLKCMVVDKVPNRFPLMDILDVHRGRLETLKVGQDASLFNLPRLRRELRRFNGLREFLCQREEIWGSAICEPFAHSLETVGFFGPNVDHLMTLLINYAPNIKHIIAERLNVHGLSDMCEHFGQQLLSLNVSSPSITVNFCRRVTDCCPNVEVSIVIHMDREGAAEAIQSLGPRLVDLTCQGKRRQVFPDSLPTFNCVNLRKLCIRKATYHTVDFLDALLLEKCKLESLQLHFGAEDIYAAEECVRIIANRCKKLRHFTFRSLPLTPGAFDDLARANPRLEDVQVFWLQGDRPTRQFRMVQGLVDASIDESILLGVTSFANCPSLRRLVFADGTFSRSNYIVRFRKIAQACAPLRHRMCTVFVCGVEYLI